MSCYYSAINSATNWHRTVVSSLPEETPNCILTKTLLDKESRPSATEQRICLLLRGRIIIISKRTKVRVGGKDGVGAGVTRLSWQPPRDRSSPAVGTRDDEVLMIRFL